MQDQASRIRRPALVVAPILLCLLVIAFLAAQVMLQGPITRIDYALTLYLAGQRQPWLTRFTLFIAEAHETIRLLAATALVAIWLGWKRELASARLLLVVPAGMLLNVALKNLFQRPRPTLEEPLVQLSTYSFPSGHAVASSVFYGAMCALVFARARSRVVRALAVIAGMVMVLLVCFSRVYLGAHYLSDVIAGMAVGAACVLLFLSWRAR